jgi:uncharacterized protein (DUF2267 family)
MAAARIVEHSVEQANSWLNEVADQLESDDVEEAYRVLRAYLHALRDRLPVEECAQLAAQLPILIRGVYFQDWRPGAKAPSRSLEGFLDQVAADASLGGETSASYAATAAAEVLRRHVSAGELDDVRAVLPEALRSAVV